MLRAAYILVAVADAKLQIPDVAGMCLGPAHQASERESKAPWGLADAQPLPHHCCMGVCRDDVPAAAHCRQPSSAAQCKYAHRAPHQGRRSASDRPASRQQIYVCRVYTSLLTYRSTAAS
jgi:hypothetical protein